MPAAAVIRRARALSGFIGRKESRRRKGKQPVKGFGSTEELLAELLFLETSGEAGIPGGGVKSVDIRKNTEGEGTPLGGS